MALAPIPLGWRGARAPRGQPVDGQPMGMREAAGVDAALVERLRGGDDRAFESLFKRHYAPLLAYCRHTLGDRDEAEDALQQTFVKAHQALRGGRGPRELRPWLYAIARNCCLSAIAARRQTVPLQPLEDRTPALAGLSEEVGRREDLRELLAAIGRLPEDQRSALLLAELEDLSHQAIAMVVGCPVSKVKALIYQARCALIADRDALDTPCRDIREQLAVARGGELRRGPLRRHLKLCTGCRDFQLAVSAQRESLAVVLPALPSAGLAAAILAHGAAHAGGATSVVGAGGGIASSASGVTGGSVGCAGIGAGGVGAGSVGAAGVGSVGISAGGAGAGGVGGAGISAGGVSASGVGGAGIGAGGVGAGGVGIGAGTAGTAVGVGVGTGGGTSMGALLGGGLLTKLAAGGAVAAMAVAGATAVPSSPRAISSRAAGRPADLRSVVPVNVSLTSSGIAATGGVTVGVAGTAAGGAGAAGTGIASGSPGMTLPAASLTVGPGQPGLAPGSGTSLQALGLGGSSQALMPSGPLTVGAGTSNVARPDDRGQQAVRLERAATGSRQSMNGRERHAARFRRRHEARLHKTRHRRLLHRRRVVPRRARLRKTLHRRAHILAPQPPKQSTSPAPVTTVTPTGTNRTRRRPRPGPTTGATGPSSSPATKGQDEAGAAEAAKSVKAPRRRPVPARTGSNVARRTTFQPLRAAGGHRRSCALQLNDNSEERNARCVFVT